MKFLIFTLLFLVACDKKVEQTSAPDKKGPSLGIPPEPTIINSEFVGAPGNDPRLQDVVVNFSSLTLNTPVSVAESLGCQNFLYGNPTPVAGIPDGSVKVVSSDGGKSGQLHFGNLPYVEPSEVGVSLASMQLKHKVCNLFSRESFDFTVVNGTLTIYAIAPGKAWDGSANSFPSGTAPAAPPIKDSFDGDAANDSRLQAVTLDFSSIQLNEPVDVVAQLGCSGFVLGATNAGTDLGKPEGSVTMVSSDGGKSGQMIFGHLPYVHPSEVGLPFASMTMRNELCEIFSKEAFNFEITSSGDLELRSIAPGKPWDNTLNVFHP